MSRGWTIASVIAAVLIVLGVVTALALPRPSAAGQTDPGPVSGPVNRGTASSSVTATPTPTPSGRIDGYGPQAPAAPPTATSPGYQTRAVSPDLTSWKKADRSSPSAVATAFLTVYDSRTSAQTDTWTQTEDLLATGNLVKELTQQGNLAVDGKDPTAVVSVKFSKGPVAEFGRDTPIRWSRTATVLIDTREAGRIEAQYRVAAEQGEDGWVLTDVATDYYRVADK